MTDRPRHFCQLRPVGCWLITGFRVPVEAPKPGRFERWIARVFFGFVWEEL